MKAKVEIMQNDSVRLPAAWQAIGRTVRGATHARRDMPNQDAVNWFKDPTHGLPLIMAVSDGHGNAKSFRSDRGANLAVHTAIALLRQFVADQPDSPNPSAIKHALEEVLPTRLVHTWKMQVQAHRDEYPFTSTELERLDSDSCKAIDEEPWLAYGATLLAVVVANSLLFYLQLGDGDILIVSEAADVYRPLPPDERLFANMTTSLITKNPLRDCRTHLQMWADPLPAMILLSTDGYVNSFRSETDFLQVGTDLLGLIRTHGLGEVEANLETWLHESSQSGSGDDITLGIICRTDALSAIGSPEATTSSAPADLMPLTLNGEMQETPISDPDGTSTNE